MGFFQNTIKTFTNWFFFLPLIDNIFKSVRWHQGLQLEDMF